MYGKLFASLYQGTLRGQSDAILVFTNMIAYADSEGFVDKHPRAIADETGLPIDRVMRAIETLMAPDPESRSPENDGKRLVFMDEHRNWGWKIVNHAKYRAIRSEEDRREQNRLAQQRYRERHNNVDSKQSKPDVSNVSRGKPKQKQKQKQKQQAEAEAEAEAENNNGGKPPVASRRFSYSDDFERWWKCWPSTRKSKKGDAFKQWKIAVAERGVEFLQSAVEAWAASPKGRGRYCPEACVWLKAGAFDGDRDSWQIYDDDDLKARDGLDDWAAAGDVFGDVNEFNANLES